MALDKQVIEFRRDELREPIEALQTVIASGRGWVNIEPVVDESVLEALRRDSPPAMLRLFSGRGSKIPFGTYVPGSRDKPGQVGLDHSGGPRSVPRLREAGIRVPEGWRLRQDHGKRGIVFDVPPDAAPGELLNWVLDSATFLAGVELSGWWSVAVFQRPT